MPTSDLTHAGPALFYAARSGDAEAVQNALDAGADLNHLGPLKRAPLHAAIESRKFHIAPLLIKAGARLDIHEGMIGATPLGMLQALRCPQTVEMLLEAGADPDAVDDCGSSPTLLAMQGGHPLSALALARASSRKDHQDHFGTALHHAASRRPFDMVEELIRLGFEVEARSPTGATPLFHAMENGNIGAAKSLLAAGADPNSHAFPCEKNMTCLMAAALHGGEAAMELLLSAGADLHARDSGGFDAEALATQSGRAKEARWLRRRRKLFAERDAIELASGPAMAQAAPSGSAPRI